MSDTANDLPYYQTNKLRIDHEFSLLRTYNWIYESKISTQYRDVFSP